MEKETSDFYCITGIVFFSFHFILMFCGLIFLINNENNCCNPLPASLSCLYQETNRVTSPELGQIH